jgi:toxin ParE1/3/4
MRNLPVVLTHDAERDLEQLHRYVAEHDSPASATRLLDRVLEVCDSLELNPERGSVPRELQALGIREYRQVFFKPYRLLYRQSDRQVVIYLIVDGRRDLQSILAERMLSQPR